ncbi:MAG: hypothetical protein EpisKO_05960 [Epibacterium sp.]
MLDLTVQDFSGEPRMRDVDIAGALGFERPRDIRELIARCADRLAGFGEIICRNLRQINRRGRDPSEYWLNEHQAFYLCTQSRAARAIEVTQQIINVFVAWRHDRQSAPMQPQSSRVFDVSPDTPVQLALVREARLLHGRAAGREVWRSLGFPNLPCEADEPLRPALEDRDPDILLFLRECFVFTGNSREFVRSRTVYEAYCAFLDGVPPLGPRALAARLHELSGVYRCPSSGQGFWPAKSNHTGYRGLRLIS